MRFLIITLLTVFILSGCKKTVENVQLDALMKLITNGQWKVTSFSKGNDDITGQFAPYHFQFKENGTVDAISNGAVQKTGSWVGNATDLTIQSDFGNAGAPLNFLNGTWSVKKTSTTHVEATQQVNAELWALRLDKL